jgi:murein DD-endopeptidase MepM/ murein hydrolase activator NlpD
MLLVTVLLASVGAIGFFFGRETRSDPAEPISRSRTVEPLVAPEIPPAPMPGPKLPPDNSVLPPPSEQADGAPLLAKRRVGLPIANLELQDIHDTFDDARGGGERRHEATDIMAPRGTPVLAAVDGIIKKLFTSVPGGLTIYQFDSQEQYCYYYAHLDRYATDAREGMLVKQGTVIGYVGSTGNADPAAPHLHFAIFELGPDKTWWKDTRPVDPYPILLDVIRSR